MFWIPEQLSSPKSCQLQYICEKQHVQGALTRNDVHDYMCRLSMFEALYQLAYMLLNCIADAGGAALSKGVRPFAQRKH